MASALIVSASFPWSDSLAHGVFQRLHLLVEACTHVAEDTHCLFLVGQEESVSTEALREHEERLQRRWSRKISITLASTLNYGATPYTRWDLYGRGVLNFYDNELIRPYHNEATRAAVMEALRRKPEIILAHRLPVMSVLSRMPREALKPPVLFDLDDIEHISLARRLWRHPGWPSERLKLLQIPAMIWGERRAIRAATSTFVCSTNDQHYLSKRLRASTVEVIPNSVRIPPLSLTGPTEQIVLFVGTFGYYPNAAAADYLVQRIWPIVRAAIPAAQLYIVGRKPEQLRSYGDKPDGVTFTGFVENIDLIYSKTRVVCCPITSGAGTRIKIIEAAAYGRAVVSTPLGAEGLEFTDRSEIVLATTTREIAEECVEMLRRPEKAATLGAAARTKAALLYDRASIVEKLVHSMRAADPERLKASTSADV